MAILEFINGKNRSLMGMNKLINYVKREDKTTPKLTYGHQCSPNRANDDFLMTKNVHNKLKGRQYIHFTQSWKEDENITPELANKIGQELLQHKLFKEFQVVMATHIDRPHLHNHFVIQTVNINNGKKWRMSNAQLESLKEYNDVLNRKYGLDVIERKIGENERHINRGEYRSQQRGESWKSKMLSAATIASSFSKNEKMFKERMRNLGYNIEEENNLGINDISKISLLCGQLATNVEEYKTLMKSANIEVEWNKKVSKKKLLNEISKECQEHSCDLKGYEKNIQSYGCLLNNHVLYFQEDGEPLDKLTFNRYDSNYLFNFFRNGYLNENYLRKKIALEKSDGDKIFNRLSKLEKHGFIHKTHDGYEIAEKGLKAQELLKQGDKENVLLKSVMGENKNFINVNDYTFEDNQEPLLSLHDLERSVEKERRFFNLKHNHSVYKSDKLFPKESHEKSNLYEQFKVNKIFYHMASNDFDDFESLKRKSILNRHHLEKNVKNGNEFWRFKTKDGGMMDYDCQLLSTLASHKSDKSESLFNLVQDKKFKPYNPLIIDSDKHECKMSNLEKTSHQYLSETQKYCDEQFSQNENISQKQLDDKFTDAVSFMMLFQTSPETGVNKDKQRPVDLKELKTFLNELKKGKGLYWEHGEYAYNEK